MSTTAATDVSALLDATDRFADRHNGPDPAEVRDMLDLIGATSLEELINDAVPEDIRLDRPLDLPASRTEAQALADLREIVEKNIVRRSLIGMGYAACETPAVILRNLFENPGWYTQYTPYQAEISQGRLEALLNFQQMVSDLTGLPLANASLLDEATAAAEAMAMAKGIAGKKKNTFVIDAGCHPQTIGVVTTRARTMGIDVRVTTQISNLKSEIAEQAFGVLVQYPTTTGAIVDYRELAERVHEAGGLVVAAADILSLCVLTPPGEWGADICVGNTQRFGVPMGFGGPHAAFMATLDKHARKMPGRLVGVSKDAHGDVAYRLTLQTREQHIRRDKATSNICTAQVLLAIMASMFAVYHGPEGLRRIAERVRLLTAALAAGLQRVGHEVTPGPRFDTVHVKPVGLEIDQIVRVAGLNDFNFRRVDDGLCITLDQRTDRDEVQQIIECFSGGGTTRLHIDELAAEALDDPEAWYKRTTGYLTHPVFNTHHSEHELLRYLQRLQSKDLSLTHSMIPLGSCTMKLNAAAEMLPVSWPGFSELHPYAPTPQTKGYAELFEQLETWLSEITGFAAVSLQPNAGSQGEYAGLLAIRRYHESRGDTGRDICLIPDSAHGTNPASAVIAGMKVVVIKCQDNGDIDLDDLTAKCEEHSDKLAALMVTYPSTHGVFEKHIRTVCQVVHDHGGQVYMDGANMNAQVGLCRPGDFGADVCHLNLHKTFCIPHGGGGPGMGPIGVAEHLAPFLPGDPTDADSAAVSAAPFGSPSILPISWMYIAMMGPAGLKRATELAILNANYMAKRLEGHFGVLFTGNNGRVAHEFIIDARPFKNVTVEDIAKRLMDYGFHAPTMSWPVSGTLMIEPTESETKAELDRFCDAMIAIRGEIDEQPELLKNAPHTVHAVSGDEWPHPYSRQQAAYALPWVRANKFWPSIGRIDNVYGDRNVVCTCPPIESYAQS